MELDKKPQNWPTYLKVRVLVPPKSRKTWYKEYYSDNGTRKWRYKKDRTNSLRFRGLPRPRLIVGLGHKKGHNTEIFDYVFDKKWKVTLFRLLMWLFHNHNLPKE